MKATTIIKIYHVLKEENYETKVYLVSLKDGYAWMEIWFMDHFKLHKVLLSKVYKERYILKILDGIEFELRKLKKNE